MVRQWERQRFVPVTSMTLEPDRAIRHNCHGSSPSCLTGSGHTPVVRPRTISPERHRSALVPQLLLRSALERTERLKSEQRRGGACTLTIVTLPSNLRHETGVSTTRHSPAQHLPRPSPNRTGGLSGRRSGSRLRHPRHLDGSVRIRTARRRARKCRLVRTVVRLAVVHHFPRSAACVHGPIPGRARIVWERHAEVVRQRTPHAGG
jgi:hypothetical protein